MLRIILFTAALCVSAVNAFSQSDSIKFINGLPVSDDDTARQFLQRDLSPEDRMRPVAPKDLPSDLQETLEDDLYAGWRDTTVYYDVNTDLYLVHVKDVDGLKIFGMNARGKPVTFNQVVISKK